MCQQNAHILDRGDSVILGRIRLLHQQREQRFVPEQGSLSIPSELDASALRRLCATEVFPFIDSQCQTPGIGIATLGNSLRVWRRAGVAAILLTGPPAIARAVPIDRIGKPVPGDSRIPFCPRIWRRMKGHKGNFEQPAEDRTFALIPRSKEDPHPKESGIIQMQNTA
jgi:hypothetical protein